MVAIFITLLTLYVVKDITELHFKEGKYKKTAKIILTAIYLAAVPINVFIILYQNEESNVLGNRVAAINSTVDSVDANLDETKFLQERLDESNYPLYPLNIELQAVIGLAQLDSIQKQKFRLVRDKFYSYK